MFLNFFKGFDFFFVYCLYICVDMRRTRGGTTHCGRSSQDDITHNPRVLHKVRLNGDPQHLLVKVLLLLQLKRLDLYHTRRRMLFTTMRL